MRTPSSGAWSNTNIETLNYDRYEFFIGAYPNDEKTLNAVRALESRFANVHMAICPHDGPTSKADCLNWIYQQMLLHEELYGERFDIVMTHDAEDVIHPESLQWVNYYADRYGMIQVPVLPLPTPFSDLISGIYCDEFGEYQTKDIPARQLLGGFVPSNGVGTGYTREALQSLAESSANRIFEPACLTEDYENGFRLHRLGCRQLFIPVTFQGAAPMATREYFPSTFRAAVKQRTRWVTGIALQGWERHGWTGGWREKYWWWRDRKGLLGNPVSTLTNGIFFYGLLSFALGPIDRRDLGHGFDPRLRRLACAADACAFSAFPAGAVYGYSLRERSPILWLAFRAGRSRSSDSGKWNQHSRGHAGAAEICRREASRRATGLAEDGSFIPVAIRAAGSAAGLAGTGCDACAVSMPVGSSRARIISAHESCPDTSTWRAGGARL